MKKTNKKPQIALIGNPNCGKTELFNRLTGDKQKVGNWPGVTVDKIEGFLNINHEIFHMIDLPGCYSFELETQQHALDETITTTFLYENQPKIIINIVHALHLQRHLYLTLQLLEAKIPTIIAVNMADQLKKEGLSCHFDQLSHALNCPIIPISAKYNTGINALKAAIVKQHTTPIIPTTTHLPDTIIQSATLIEKKLPKNNYNPSWIALRLLESQGQNLSIKPNQQTLDILKQQQRILADYYHEDLDIIFAEFKYKTIEKWLPSLYERHHNPPKNWTKKIDQLLLNRWFGLPFFLAIMYLVFLVCIDISHCFGEPLDTLSTLWFIDTPSALLAKYHVSSQLIHFYQHSFGIAITTTISFIPVLFLLFFCLNLLEHSGYMARAAFVMDKIMGILKLPGRSFVSLLIGFGCNVPSVMSTRTLTNQHDRVLTTMMAPFMSCSARLAVYVIFVQACFPQGGQNIIFMLYFIGIAIAIFTGFLLRLTHFSQKREPLTLELPKYLVPSFKLAWRDSRRRVKNFLKRTFKFMLPACFVLACLQSLHPIPFGSTAHTSSVLEQLAKLITPLFSPIGIDANNWPATIALILGAVAKEIMVGVLNTLYATPPHATLQMPHLWHESWQAIQQIVPLLQSLWHNLLHPLQASTGILSINTTSQHAIQQHFVQSSSVIAFLIFTCLYIPCFSTIAVIHKEFSAYWASIATVWSFLIAFIMATLYYQSATWTMHPLQTISWYGGFFLLLVTLTLLLKHQQQTLTKGKCNESK